MFSCKILSEKYFITENVILERINILVAAMEVLKLPGLEIYVFLFYYYLERFCNYI